MPPDFLRFLTVELPHVLHRPLSHGGPLPWVGLAVAAIGIGWRGQSFRAPVHTLYCGTIPVASTNVCGSATRSVVTGHALDWGLIGEIAALAILGSWIAFALAHLLVRTGLTTRERLRLPSE